MNHEGSTGTPDDAALQIRLYNIFQSKLAKKYWVQDDGIVRFPQINITLILTSSFFQLGTLGNARGKLTLLQRFNYNLLPSASTQRIGIHLDSSQWTDNGAAIEIVYNEPKKQIAFIEDYYEIGLPVDAGTAPNVQWKFNATTAHIENATLYNPDQLYISFASAEHNTATPTVSPRVRTQDLHSPG